MDTDDIWSAIDAQRAELADLLDTLTDAQWATPSLCAAWTVRDVAAHLTLAQVSLGSALWELTRSGFRLDRMIRETAQRQARRPTAEYGDRLRAMAGSRRKPPGTVPADPLVDALVHGQDIAVPLGLERPVTPELAPTALGRAWTSPAFGARRRLAGVRLVATDADWTEGNGPEVRGDTRALLLLVTGRRAAAVPHLTGEGVAAL